MSEQRAQNFQKYVCEVNSGLGAFVIFELVPAQSKCLVHELWQFDVSSGINAALSLTRFIEVYARHLHCRFVEMAGEFSQPAIHLFKNDDYSYQDGHLYKELY